MIQPLDLQINGCFGVDFNSDGLSEEMFAIASRRLYEVGTRGFLATVITDDVELMKGRIAALARCITFMQRNSHEVAKCLGIHIEGPFLSPVPGFIGAHPVKHAGKARVDIAKALLDAGQGHVKLMTLAPEQDSDGSITRFLTEKKIVVSAGHTNASREEILRCVDQGLYMLTHFGNACPADLPRHDNILWRMMSLERNLYVSLIVDGHHLPLWMIPVLIDRFGADRVVCVSDAISAAGLGKGVFRLGHRTVVIGDDLVARDVEQRHFVGSTSLLFQCEANLRSLNRYTEAELQQMLETNAKDVLRSRAQ